MCSLSKSSEELNDFLDRGSKLPILDGLRGWAIILVILFHSSFHGFAFPVLSPFFSGFCWSGVDLFFVLSGFLITNVLMQHKGKPNYFKNFYVRRVLRIFPLYYGFLLFMLLCYGDLQGYYYHLFFLSNFLVAHYILPAHNPAGLTWSVSIEEQFYAVWPLLVFLLGRKGMMTAVVLSILCATTLRFINFLTEVPSVTTFFSTQTRMDGLAYGALLALLLHHNRNLLPCLRRIAMVIILTMPMAMMLTWHLSQSAYYAKTPLTVLPFGLTLIYLFYTALLTLLISGASPWTELLFKNQFILLAGKHSYCMYLIHLEIILLLKKIFLTQYPLHPVIVAMTLGLAIVIWHAFEKHFLDMKKHFSYDKVQRPPLKTSAPESI